MDAGFGAGWMLSEAEARYGPMPIFATAEGMRDSIWYQSMQVSVREKQNKRDKKKYKGKKRPSPVTPEARLREKKRKRDKKKKKKSAKRSHPVSHGSEPSYENCKRVCSEQDINNRRDGCAEGDTMQESEQSSSREYEQMCYKTEQSDEVECGSNISQRPHQSVSPISILRRSPSEKDMNLDHLPGIHKSTDMPRQNDVSKNQSDNPSKNTNKPPADELSKDEITPLRINNNDETKTEESNSDHQTHMSQDTTVVHSDRRLINRPIIPQETETILDNLLACDSLLDISDISGLNAEKALFATDAKDTTQLLCGLGDMYLERLARWTKKLPFLKELPIGVFSQLLSNKWHELLLLITTAFRAVDGRKNDGMTVDDVYEDCMDQLMKILCRIFQRQFTLGQLETEVGRMMSAIACLVHYFAEARLSREEYVCLQVCLLLSQRSHNPALMEALCLEVSGVLDQSGALGHCEAVGRLQDRYNSALKDYTSRAFPAQPDRSAELLLWLPKIQAAAKLLIQSKMIYVPFFLNP